MPGKTLREAIREAAKDRETALNLRERVKLRIVLRRKPELLEREILNHAQVEGVLPTSATLDDDVGAVDWDALLNFIKEVLPIILQLIQLFG